MVISDENIETEVVYLECETSLLPPFPASDNADEVKEFESKMDDILEHWIPEPPAGEGWSLVSKDWYCEDVCGKCETRHHPETGRCIYQGVRLHRVWQRDFSSCLNPS